MKRTWIIPAVAVAITVAAVGYRTADGRMEQAPAADRKPDEAALRKVMEGFTAAFEKGDAAAAAAFLTTGAELIPDDGPAVHGRDAIQTAFAAHFAKSPRVKIVPTADAVRFTSRDTALEEGHMTVSPAA